MQEQQQPSAPTLPEALQSKWSATYGRPLDLRELLIVEAFQHLVQPANTLFRFPDIPEKKIGNAKSKYAKVRSSELVLALIDDTMFGSALDGAVLTTESIYWHNSGEDARSVSYTDLVPDQIQFVETWLGKKVVLSPTLHVVCTTSDKLVVSAVAKFIQRAAASTIAVNGHTQQAVFASSQASLRMSLGEGLFDTALIGIIESQVLQAEARLPQPASIPVTIEPAPAPASQIPDSRRALSRREFARTKEDLEMLQFQVARWFKAKDFSVDKQSNGSVHVVIAGKESLWRSIAGSRQKYIVRIEQHATNYSVEMGLGELEEKSTGGKAATALVNLYTLGAPFLLGQNEADSVQKEFGVWLEDRASRVCPACEKNDAKNPPTRKTLAQDTKEEQHYGQAFTIKSVTTIQESACKFCGHIWADGKKSEHKTVEMICPECDQTADYDCALLDRAKSFTCTHCGTGFSTRAQFSYQYEQQERQILEKIKSYEKVMEVASAAAKMGIAAHDRIGANQTIAQYQQMQTHINQLQQTLLQLRAERDRRMG